MEVMRKVHQHRVSTFPLQNAILEINSVCRKVPGRIRTRHNSLPLFLAVLVPRRDEHIGGGPDSASKREWFAQETIDLIKANPEEDAEWIETFLLQVMLDEFEVNVDDDSGFEVAEQLVRLRRDCGKGDFREVVEMKRRWDSMGGREDVGKII